MIFLLQWVAQCSDHGLEEIYADDFTDAEIDAIFNKIHGRETT